MNDNEIRLHVCSGDDAYGVHEICMLLAQLRREEKAYQRRHGEGQISVLSVKKTDGGVTHKKSQNQKSK